MLQSVAQPGLSLTLPWRGIPGAGGRRTVTRKVLLRDFLSLHLTSRARSDPACCESAFGFGDQTWVQAHLLSADALDVGVVLHHSIFFNE